MERGRSSMTAAQLVVFYYFNPPKEAPHMEPLVSDATQQVIPYHEWILLKCACCGRKGGVSGLWQCEFTNGIWPMLLCAACAFGDAFSKWTGFFSRKILKIDLLVTITYPSRSGGSSGKAAEVSD